MITQTFGMPLDTFPILHSERLDLVEIKQIHRPDLFKLLTDEMVVKYYNLKSPGCEEDTQKYIDWFNERYINSLGIRWGLALKGTPNIIGTIGFSNFNNLQHAHIVYDLMTVHWNNGYITEALRKIIGYGFSVLHIKAVKAEVMNGNIASEKVLQKLHFENKGVLNSWMYVEELKCDISTFSLSKKDYILKNQKPLEAFEVAF